MGVMSTPETLRNKFTAKWLSLCILRTSNTGIVKEYRKLENSKIKLVKAISHQKFNETCLQHSLLPKYTNIYMCVCVLNIVG